MDIQELRRQFQLKKKMESRQNELLPEDLANSREKFYLIWKKHRGQRHDVLLADNGVYCATCKLLCKE